MRKFFANLYSIAGEKLPAGLPTIVSLLARILAKLLHFLPPETAHNLGLWTLRTPLVHVLPPLSPPKKHLTSHSPAFGPLAHPVGLAAGYDKNGASIEGLFRLGFSFVEIGTITPKAQHGQEKPRVFRGRDTSELINRMGFPNHGAFLMRRTLARLREQPDLSSSSSLHHPGYIGPIGINIGKNKHTPLDAAVEDYITCIEMLHIYAAYFVINISSPNTPGLRSLASETFFQVLAERVAGLDGTLMAKLWIKLSPDDDRHTFQKHIEHILASGFAGIILTNTHAVTKPYKGGLSGHSLQSLAFERLLWAKEVHEGHLPMIAVGGIMTGGDILHAMKLGASCVQIYTAMVYRGPQVVQKMLTELENEMQHLGLESIEQLRSLHS